MKRIAAIVVMTLVFLMPEAVFASSKINLYFFHGSTCPHCYDAKDYLNEITDKYPDLEIIGYEVWEDEENAKLWQQVKDVLNSDSKGVPFIVVGERFLTGFGDYRKQDIKNAIDYYVENPGEYQDVVSQVIKGSYEEENEQKQELVVHPVSMIEERKKSDLKKAYFYGIILILIGIVYLVWNQILKKRNKG